MRVCVHEKASVRAELTAAATGNQIQSIAMVPGTLVTTGIQQ